MPGADLSSGFLKSRQARVLTAVLIAQAALFYTLSRGEAVPASRPLSEFPSQLGHWSLASEGVVDKDVQDVLRADDTLSRLYARRGTGEVAGLFVAYFKTQRTGQTPHSPKNCLPGAGWVPSSSGVVAISTPVEPEPIRVNRYVVARGPEKSVVFYWYQSRNRVIASEYMAKVYSVLDAIRYNRSDTTLVRVVVPVIGNDEQRAAKTGIDFVQSLFPPLRRYLPS